MRTSAALFAFFFLIQGPLCALHAVAGPAAAQDAPQSETHDCCPGSQAAGESPAPSQDHHGKDLDAVACAVHCASLTQALSSAVPAPGKLTLVALLPVGPGLTIGEPVAPNIGPLRDRVSLLLADLTPRTAPLLI